jgi:hypothetical protein
MENYQMSTTKISFGRLATWVGLLLELVFYGDDASPFMSKISY